MRRSECCGSLRCIRVDRRRRNDARFDRGRQGERRLSCGSSGQTVKLQRALHIAIAPDDTHGCRSISRGLGEKVGHLTEGSRLLLVGRAGSDQLFVFEGQFSAGVGPVGVYDDAAKNPAAGVSTSAG